MIGIRRSFKYQGEDWEVIGPLGGFDTGTGDKLPRISNFGVQFICTTDPSQGPYYGHVPGENLEKLPEECFIEALEEAITKAWNRKSSG